MPPVRQTGGISPFSDALDAWFCYRYKFIAELLFAKLPKLLVMGIILDSLCIE